MIKMSIISSSYSNKAFISYCEKTLNNYKLCLVKPGMKNLERESKKYDISLCYEYNGQGTIYINKELTKKFGQLSCLIETSKDSQIIELFQLFIALFNCASTDGIANLLIIESLLKVMNLSIKDIYNFYEEIPYKMIDVKINSNNEILANNDETKLLEPKNIQNKIDKIMSKYNNCRVLVRPSRDDDDCLKFYLLRRS
jgi:phosphoacetylglucosamine mutase